jgi:hypothetical protein
MPERLYARKSLFGFAFAAQQQVGRYEESFTPLAPALVQRDESKGILLLLRANKDGTLVGSRKHLNPAPCALVPAAASKKNKSNISKT